VHFASRATGAAEIFRAPLVPGRSVGSGDGSATMGSSGVRRHAITVTVNSHHTITWFPQRMMARLIGFTVKIL